MEGAYYLEVYVPMSSKWTIAYIKKAGITEDNRHAEISTTFPHQVATPKQQMLKWRHHSTKWSTKSIADDRPHQRRDKQDNWLTDWLTDWRLKTNGTRTLSALCFTCIHCVPSTSTVRVHYRPLTHWCAHEFVFMQRGYIIDQSRIPLYFDQEQVWYYYLDYYGPELDLGCRIWFPPGDSQYQTKPKCKRNISFIEMCTQW